MVLRRCLQCTLIVGGMVILWLLGVSKPADTFAQSTCDRFVLGSGGADASNCGDAAHPCRTIQYAIDQAAEGDEVCVASSPAALPLVYHERISVTLSITLDGAWSASCTGSFSPTCSFTPIPCDPANVVIDADHLGRVVTIDGTHHSGTLAPVIQCLTLTGGNAEGLGGDPGGAGTQSDAGGGVFSIDAAPIIAYTVISGNYGCELCGPDGGRGGGVYLRNASTTAQIHDSLIAHNVAATGAMGYGGGMMLRNSDAQVYSNTVSHNLAGSRAGEGGGIAVYGGSPWIADNALVQNSAAHTVIGSGGGLHLWTDQPVTVLRNTFQYNKAITGIGDLGLTSTGGGASIVGGSTAIATIRGNSFDQNATSLLGPDVGWGGGLYVSGLVSPSLIIDNSFHGNIAGHNAAGYGGGLYVDAGSVVIEGNDFTGNAATWSGTYGEGGGLYISGGTNLVQSNVITGNAGASTASGCGGGIAIRGGATVVYGNRIVANDATRGDNWGMGGGVCAMDGQVTLRDNTIEANSGSLTGDNGIGGGVALSGTVALLDHNLVIKNLATGGEWGMGGGIYGGEGTFHVLANIVTDNDAALVDRGFGGGAYFQFGAVWLDANKIRGNRASQGAIGIGGGLRLAANAAFTVTNNVIARNGFASEGCGVAILNPFGGRVFHNTIADNRKGDGVGVLVAGSGTLSLTNNIVARHKTGIKSTMALPNDVVASHTLLEDNATPVVGIVNQSPVAGPAMLLSDYHIAPDSAAIDAGIDVGVAYDMDGEARPQGAGYDVGADEQSVRLFLPMILRLQ